jgi:hypothetical protein
MPVYSLPNFNTTFNWWQQDDFPYANVATYVAVSCQYYYNPRIGLVNYATLCRTPVDLTKNFDNSDNTKHNAIIEMPAGSGRYYNVYQVAIVHAGFPNEYWVLTCTDCDDHGNSTHGHVP